MFHWGFYHIIAWDATDHLLFILCLCAGLRFRDYKKALQLTFAFALGHSIPIALRLSEIIPVAEKWIELAIAATIAIAAATGLAFKPREKFNPTILIVTLCFGVIHGLGFSSAFSMIADHARGMSSDLLIFSLGIEVAQILVVAIILSVHFMIHALKFDLMRLRRYELLAALLLSAIIMVQRLIN
jgi:hypothetical protein